MCDHGALPHVRCCAEAHGAATAQTEAPSKLVFRRKKLWEIKDGLHCGVVGTCLTLKDLRTLARKLNVKPVPGFPADYQLHGYFVTQASEAGGKAAKMLTGLLDRRYARAIKAVAKLTDTDALLAHWNQHLDDGDIPGPFWAIVSHPHVTEDLADHLYADVHMLSHLVGSSNRADIKRLNALENELAEARREIEEVRTRHAHRMAEKAQEIDDLRDQLSTALVRASSKAEPEACQSLVDEADRLSLLARIEELETQNRDLTRTIKGKDGRIIELSQTLSDVQAECQSLERLLPGTAAEDEDDGDDLPDLNGERILYVGGKKQSVHRFRDLVAQCNGELVHHDGGLEQSIGELTSAITRADRVLFPCDRVSHMAAGQLKKICQQQMKPFVPLRSCGVAPLMDALQDTTPVMGHGDD